MRTIALVNHSALLGGADVAPCGAALQTQVSRDFAATWGIDARLRVTDEPAEDEELLALLDDADGAAALVPPGRGGRPCGFVLVRPCLEAGDAWQAAASHQLLELLADPLVNLAAEGVFQGKPALFALEVCDPVETDSYAIAGVPVANCVLPTWFAPGPLADETLLDFLGRLAEPFSVTPAGHAAYCTEPGRWQAWFGKRCPKHRRQPAACSRRRRRKVTR